jgi:nitronate monooxygenase
LLFLNRGQGWVVRKLAELLPRLTDAAMRDALAEMHHRHVDNIRTCEKFL